MKKLILIATMLASGAMYGVFGFGKKPANEPTRAQADVALAAQVGPKIDAALGQILDQAGFKSSQDSNVRSIGRSLERAKTFAYDNADMAKHYIDEALTKPGIDSKVSVGGKEYVLRTLITKARAGEKVF